MRTSTKTRTAWMNPFMNPFEAEFDEGPYSELSELPVAVSCVQYNGQIFSHWEDRGGNLDLKYEGSINCNGHETRNDYLRAPQEALREDLRQLVPTPSTKSPGSAKQKQKNPCLNSPVNEISLLSHCSNTLAIPAGWFGTPSEGVTLRS